MRLRWKLMLLLMVIAIVPVVTAAMIARTSNRRMGREMTRDISQVLLDNAYQHLRQLTDRAVATIERDRSSIETSVDVQAMALERLLAGDPLMPGRVYFDEEFDDPQFWPPGTFASSDRTRYDDTGNSEPMMVTYDVPVIRLLPGATAQGAAADIARLNSLKDTFVFLKQRHPDLIFWQFAATESGVHCSYPGHGGYPAEFDSRQRLWYELARQRDEGVWAPPIIDATSRQILLTRARPFHDAEGNFVGVTGIDVSMMRLLEDVRLPETWEAHAEVVVCMLDRVGSGGDAELRVIAKQDYAGLERDWDVQIDLEVLGSEDAAGFRTLLEEIRAGQSSVHRMPYQGRDALWACGPLQSRKDSAQQASAFALLLIVPFEEVIAFVTQTETKMANRFNSQLEFTGLLMVIVIAIVVVLAFLSSRVVSRPIRLLAQTATRISEGDLEARAEITSRDEIGELARAFNVMVPHLRDRMKLKESLALAKEVQQHLLPAGPPDLEGLDIAGRSVYCDETGGDYFDFLQPAESGSREVGVVIGDVTGHGIAAALLMTAARALLHIRAARSGDLAQVITDMNRYLAQDTPSGRFMTFFYLHLDLATRSARWVSAGHDPAIVYDPSDDTFDELEGVDIPLGVDETWTFHEKSRTDLRAGQIIVLGTDGIWEARNDRDEMFGKDRLRAVIRNHAKQSSEQIVEKILEAIETFRDGHPQEDDITMIVMKFTE